VSPTALPTRPLTLNDFSTDADPVGTDGASLLSQLLHEQHQLTAVEAFSRDHESSSAPAQAKYYSRLLPANPPGPGQQYAFEVDLDRCSGCKACVTACHSLNGLDQNETWRDVGLLLGGTAAQPVMQHVTTACHHCLEPGCLKACPVDAYVKDPVTGIVKHLDDQCFGCQYCTLACPYDVPKYHAKKGIVRKCDMCSNRLAVGEAPACVQACPHEAIAIRIVSREQVIEDCDVGQFLPGAPDPHLTLPTTTFKTNRVFPRNTAPADYHQVAPQHPHWPLIMMLVLTQLSVGALTAGQVVASTLHGNSAAQFVRWNSAVALACGWFALFAALLHLGRPQYAFRAFIGLRHSWLSREIVAFGAFAKIATAFAVAAWLWPTGPIPYLGVTAGALGKMTTATGLGAVFCSAMIYIVTGREAWGLFPTLSRFFLTTVVLGATTLGTTILLLEPGSYTHGFEAFPVLDASDRIWKAVIGSVFLKLAIEAAVLQHLLRPGITTLKRTAQLMAGPLGAVTGARFVFGLLGGVLLPWLILQELGRPGATDAAAVMAILSLVFLIAGELAERYLYFAAVAAPRMPGGIRT
jgi:formate dehydrogenase iron-sulfur subunit